MDQEPHLSGEQRRRITDLAEKLGLGWKEVLKQALDFSRVKSSKKANPDDIIGCFADDPELIDEVVEHAYRMRGHAPLRTESDA